MDEKDVEQTVTLSVNANFLMVEWLVIYGVIMRQAQNSDYDKQQVIKACKRALEDLEDNND